ncbi:class I SAM-dependent methyltransferase [Paenibacillus sinopodophylli]|uniref:class I SAM-dependent methyltransferase n=1 Tax=Paenibacillus sinopodophylli TaxID=1837342 RepID=UPI00110CAD33|nr:class I SAM-dependent methyltransferase [Paenibacillus sinopodophylli]
MYAIEKFHHELREFSEKFNDLAMKYDKSIHRFSELETVIGEYSSFVTSKSNKEIWEQLVQLDLSDWKELVMDVRKKSAICVAIMEKYRAWKLMDGEAGIADYFRNIEACIEKEFGSSQVTSDSKVILVGSGSYPMTPLFIAQRTGAEVVGIDIDDEAIILGQKVVDILGADLPIRLVKTPLEHLAFTREATHIIFSSTVPNKYDLLDQLHAYTNEQVVVAMRYGNQLKSLFNYPMEEVDGRKWSVADHILRPDDVFDIALYKKTQRAKTL